MGKTDIVKWDTMIGEIQQGGLKMIDFEAHCLSLKASWIKRLHEADVNTQILDTISYMSSYKITNQTPFKNIPPFYKQVIQGNIQCNVSHTSQDKNTAVNVLQMCIWGNRYVTNKMGDML